MNMAIKIRCVWCGKNILVTERVHRNDYGEVKERRCPQCNGILAAYLVEDKPVLQEVRVFKD